jgi:hypothetical protein
MFTECVLVQLVAVNAYSAEYEAGTVFQGGANNMQAVHFLLDGRCACYVVVIYHHDIAHNIS